MRNFCLPFTVLLVAGLLAGCGQKGPLYRPDAGAQAVEAQNGETTESKKSRSKLHAPQTQKEQRPDNTTPSSSSTAPPATDPNRPASPPPGT